MKKLVLLLALSLSLCACGTSALSQTTVETPAETPPANTQPTDPLKGLTLRQKVGQLFVVRPDSLDFTQTQEQINDAKAEGVTAVTGELLAALEQYPVGGIAVFGKNIQSPDQLRQFTADVRDHRFQPENDHRFQPVQMSSNSTNIQNAVDSIFVSLSYLRQYGSVAEVHLSDYLVLSSVRLACKVEAIGSVEKTVQYALRKN